MRPSSVTHRSKQDKVQEHWKSMLMLAEEYKRCLNGNKVPKQLERTTYNRYRIAVATILWDKAMLQRESSQKVISDLKNRGLYPYGFYMALLAKKDFKTMAVNYSKFLFNLQAYYKLFYFIVKLVTR